MEEASPPVHIICQANLPASSVASRSAAMFCDNNAATDAPQATSRKETPLECPLPQPA
jgi:hypothetical protein